MSRSFGWLTRCWEWLLSCRRDGDAGHSATGDGRDRSERREKRIRSVDVVERATDPLDSDIWLAVADHLLSLCGDLTHIIIDCFAIQDASDSYITKFVMSGRLSHVHRMQTLRRSALLAALQQGCAGCRCVPGVTRPLTVISCALSGSELEGFSDLKVSQRGSSDLDIMHELGPVRCRLAEGQWPGAAAAAAADDTNGPLLTVEPTENPGFVLLRSAAAGGGLVSAARVRRLMYAALLLDSDADTEIGCSGPAAAVSPQPGHTPAGLDNVPCLRLRQWPSEEFFQRWRAQDWPPPAARDDIRRFGVHLVPVGSKHSATDEDEWRLSFSRAEVVAAWHLPDLYRAALRSVKNAKNLLGDDGKGLKSYYIKTVTLWLRQDQPSDRWRSVTEAALAILDRLDAAAAAGSLPCFFWAEIDLFRFLSGAELAALRRAVALLRARLVPLLTVWAAFYCPPALRPLLETDAGPWPLPERQIRTCLARGLICWGVMSTIQFRAEAPVIEGLFAERIPNLLRRSAIPELHWMLHAVSGRYRLQLYLLTALLVAPDDLVSSARLAPLRGGLLAWDAAPLMALLTNTDLEWLLEEPAAVRDWCRHQLSLPLAERPAGLTAAPHTPRGLANLLLNTPLLVRALSESVPGWTETISRDDQKRKRMWGRSLYKLETYNDCRTALKELLTCDLEERLRSRPATATATAAAAGTVGDPAGDAAGEMAAGLAADLSAAPPAAVARLWRDAISRQLVDPEFRTSADHIGSTLLDPWELRKYVVSGSKPAEAEEK